MEKQQLRAFVKSQLRLMSADGALRESEFICAQILSNKRIAEARCVVAFWSMPDEVDIRPAVDVLLLRGKNVYLPRITDDCNMVLCRYEGRESMRQEPLFGIWEPASDEILLPSDFSMNDICFVVPGLAFTKEGLRLGRGKGYYDRMLASYKGASKVGVCFNCQLMEDIPVGKFDVRMDEVLSFLF
ncbi:MAG: 5-formyltetrahydrofolate cyclo-ligase [Marinilabiliaceae bacterium]|nr:5-formyltetrahydrofolate cyclo-ligase [Marinilabiliaceae bacterium]